MDNDQRQSILNEWSACPSELVDGTNDIVSNAYHGHPELVHVFWHYFLLIHTLGRYRGDLDVSQSSGWEKKLSIALAISIIPIAVVVFSISEVRGNQGFGFLSVMIVVAIVAALSVVSIPSSKRRSRTQEGSCRKCGYTLDPALSVGELTIMDHTYDVGPKLCSECGQQWPLVTPH